MAVARHLPPGRHRAGDRHLNFYDSRDNLGSGATGQTDGAQQLAVAAERVSVSITHPDRQTPSLALVAERLAMTAQAETARRDRWGYS